MERHDQMLYLSKKLDQINSSSYSTNWRARRRNQEKNENPRIKDLHATFHPCRWWAFTLSTVRTLLHRAIRESSEIWIEQTLDLHCQCYDTMRKLSLSHSIQNWYIQRYLYKEISLEFYANLICKLQWDMKRKNTKILNED